MSYLLLNDHQDIDQQTEYQGMEEQTRDGRATIYGYGEETSKDKLNQLIHEGGSNHKEQNGSLDRI